MGSFVAQRVAIDHPERVARLVLVSSADVPGTRPLRELESTVRALSDPIDIGFVRQFQESTVAAPVPDAFMDRVVAESARVPARVWRDVLRGLIEMDARRELPRIVAPTLLISGEKDELFVRADQEALARSVEGARLVVYAGVGHAPHWEQPERFVNDLEGFLSSAGPLPEGLGVWHRPITTASPRAQRYFDQGLALTYAFNHVEAVRSFGEALRLDPDCAMCYWGIAYALGPNINTPMEPDAEARALEAARSLRGQA